jgi:hypothetical protein
MLRDADEAEGVQFGDCWSDAVSLDAKFLEILERNWQSAVFSTAMMSVFDLNAIENTTAGQT